MLDGLLGSSAELTPDLGTWLRTSGADPMFAAALVPSLGGKPWTALGRLLLDRADDDRPALLYEDRRVELPRARRTRAGGGRPASPSSAIRDRPPHVGVLLDNVPDYLFWLTAGALSGTVVVGINSTYRGEQLAQLIDHTDCQALVTSTRSRRRCSTARPTGVPAERLLVIDEPGYAARLDARSADRGRDARPGRRRPVPAHLHVGIDRACPRRCGARRVASAAPAPTSRASPSSPRATSCTRRSRSSTPRSLFTGWASAVNAGDPDLDAAAVLGVGHGPRHPRASAPPS